MNESTCWHYDEHPFNCIFIVDKANSGGGIFKYIKYRNSTNKRFTNLDVWWNDKKLELLLKNSSFYQNDDDNNNNNKFEIFKNKNKEMNKYISQIEGESGDFYCLFGNETLHTVTKVIGNDTRLAIVMNFATKRNFVHTTHGDQSSAYE